ncbi:hypothetical protein [Halostagnicola kamekurae]|uniref:Uncharacterized protein n=1 Tax=Halostagnicola kamekurae TaxID=619731 RepID=A0A1I6Q5X5_9EURY|nr:hypothetical protein [Halostagnicola kamekurae]SFS47715.1 hypothetical protein SAMN04488556_0997 [Halostagnicola kamekurae]
MNGRTKSEARMIRDARKIDLLFVYGCIFTSIIAIPAFLQYLFLFRGIEYTETGFLAVGTLAMLPGLLMGTTALWVTVRG